jgi:hypothetical protein
MNTQLLRNVNNRYPSKRFEKPLALSSKCFKWGSSGKHCINKFLLQQKKRLPNIFTMILSFFFVIFFEVLKFVFLNVFHIQGFFVLNIYIYKCSTWSLLFGYMIELNKCYVVEINNSKQKKWCETFDLDCRISF